MSVRSTLDVLHLRGHTPGSIALAYRDDDDPAGRTHLFTGDSLFPGGIGNTKQPGQSFEALIEDVTTRVFDVYDDDTWFYPGPRRRQHAGGGAPAPAGVARARLVAGPSHGSRGSPAVSGAHRRLTGGRRPR